MSYGLGVDLGTTFTGVAVRSGGQSGIVHVQEAVEAAPVEPPPTGEILVRGGDLLLRAGLGTAQPSPGLVPAAGLAAPVPMVLGGRPQRGAALLAASLRSVLATVTVAQGAAPAKVVLTCPAVWGPVRRRQFAEMSRQAGLGSVVVVSEPEAATACFVGPRGLDEGAVVAVYDLGAVTVDMTVVRVTGSGTEILGQPEAMEGVGGVDFDDVVLAHLDRALGGALSRLDPNDPVAAAVLDAARAECERAKETLSGDEATTLTVRLPTGAATVALSRVEFEVMIRAGLESTLAGLRRSMLSAGIGIADLTAVVLVGGSSRIPLVERMLVTALGRPMLVPEYPQHCAALGAAAIADSLPVPVESRAALGVTARSAANLAGRTGGSGAANLTGAVGAGPRDPGDIGGRGGPGVTGVTGAAMTGVSDGQASASAAPSSDGGAVPGNRRARRRQAARPANRRRVLAVGLATALLLGSGAYVAVSSMLTRASAADTRADRPAGADPVVRATTVAVASAPATTVRAPEPTALGRTATPTPKPAVTRTVKPKPVVRPLTGTGILVGPNGKCLDVQNAQTADGTGVQLFTCNGTLAQVWTARKDRSLRAFGKCLQSGADRLVISSCNGSRTQQWLIVSGRISNPRSRSCVAVVGAPNDATPAVSAACRDRPSQTWKLVT